MLTGSLFLKPQGPGVAVARGESYCKANGRRRYRSLALAVRPRLLVSTRDEYAISSPHLFNGPFPPAAAPRSRAEIALVHHSERETTGRRGERAVHSRVIHKKAIQGIKRVAKYPHSLASASRDLQTRWCLNRSIRARVIHGH